MPNLLTITMAIPALGPRLTSSQQQIVHDFRRKMRAESIWITIKEEEPEE